MTQFIGQKLQQAREEQRITLEKASESTHIRVPYLRALEAGDLSVLPSPVQARGFLRNYAEYLGLDFDHLLDELRAERDSSDEIIGPADIPPSSPDPTPEPLTSPGVAHPSPFGLDFASATESQRTPIPEKTKRRGGRNKTEPDPEPLVVPEQPEDTDEPGFATDTSIVQESDGDEAATPQREENRQPNVSESLWRNWLNRISSWKTPRARPAPLDDRLSEPEGLDTAESPPDDELTHSMDQDPHPQLESAESSRIFREIGEALCHRRELLSLHLEEVERNTHVKAHYLEALEAGAMADLPSTVQTRGMLSNYATFLDLDVDALLLRYADALQARHREKNPHKPARKPGQPIVASLPPIRSFIAGDMIFGIGMAVLLIGFSIWGINWVMTVQSQQEVQPTAPSISDVLLASPDASSITPTAALLPIESVDEPTATIVIPTQNLNVSVQVNLVAVERTFMRVVVDGEEAFNGRAVPGTAYPFEAEEQIEILVGSGAAIRIVYNGRDLGLLGGLGQVVDNIYRADEIITPTAQPTLTPTITVPATATTPPSTLTPVPTNTTAP